MGTRGHLKHGTYTQRTKMTFAVICLCLGLTSFVWCTQAAAESSPSKRLAFVAGIKEYDNVASWAELPNAANDAIGMAKTLATLGFDVTPELNSTRSSFYSSWQEFLKLISPGDVVAVAFSGHGIEIDGAIFLIPRDAPEPVVGNEVTLRQASISFQSMLFELRQKRAQFTLIILNACRKNPFTSGMMTGGSDGLAIKTDTPPGIFVMYSAGAHQTALERLNRQDNAPYSVYTRTLLPLLSKPGLNILQLASQVGVEVRDLARTVKHEQWPAFYSNAVDAEKICLSGCAPNLGTAPAPRVDIADLGSPLPPISATCDGIEDLVEDTTRCLPIGSNFKDCADCPDMVTVPAGGFVMGSPIEETGRAVDEGPEHKVTIGVPFAVSVHEITRQQFAAFVSDTRHAIPNRCWTFEQSKREERDERSFRSPGFEQGDNHPAVCVSWKDARAYVSWLSKLTGKPYRLLTESEWEYAARAGSQESSPFHDNAGTQCNFSNGADEAAKVARISNKWSYAGCNDNYVHTAPAGSFKSNAFGLHDMLGNASEWVEDCWNDDYSITPQNGDAATSGNCDNRVIRGGGWIDIPINLRVANRSKDALDKRGDNCGIRVAR